MNTSIFERALNGMQRFALLGAVLLLAANTACAASFDCAKAGTKVEKMICADPELSKLDENLSAAYQKALNKVNDPLALRREQRTWLAVDRNNCMDFDCLKSAYQYRMNELDPWQAPKSFVTEFASDKTLCGAYKHYVENEVATNKQYGHYTSPTCQRSFGEGFPEFSPINWQEINPKDHPDLAVQAYRYINFWPWDRKEVVNDLNKQSYETQLSWINLWYTYGAWHMWLGKADLGNAGHMETLLKVERGQCGELSDKPPGWMMPVLVMDQTGKGIDVNKSEWVLGVTIPLPSETQYWPSNIHPIPGRHIVTLTAFDVFEFSRKVYFDKWVDVWTKPKSAIADPRYSVLSVYSISEEKTSEICRFKFKKPID